MSAIYMSQLSTALPLMEGDHHQDHHHHQGHFQAFNLPKDPPILFPFVISNSSASDSSLSYGSGDHHHLFRQQNQAMLEPQHMIGVSSAASVFATPFPTVESIRDDMIEPSSYDPYDMGRLQVGGSLETAGSWTTPPAKMRITRKASTDPGAAKKPRRKVQGYEDMMGTSGQPNLGVNRVCSDCNTTKTPLWRSGPCGPKSLCNACGIRQRKARRAMMASAGGSGPAPADGAKAATATPRDAMAASVHHPKVKKEKRIDVDRSLPFKKRCKVVQDHAPVAAPPAAAHKAAAVPPTGEVVDASGLSSRDLVDDIGLISWSRSPAPPSSAASCSFRSSPGLPVQQDEVTDAAMLLMTLSCGLVRS
ncbi:hypothetical protein SETIT_4G234800v2 [Setaria italica]|uniref:GATA-type domain-containing protein n=1 Tax=Setaria italica TaxID=4555 RepID=K3XXS5_SETIT|nr:putative GATA transcription factor 22 [Setaria italica]RCV22618.1 hypothetical protein SETIT_4G234800v2 [Setaria italica]